MRKGVKPFLSLNLFIIQVVLYILVNRVLKASRLVTRTKESIGLASGINNIN